MDDRSRHGINDYAARLIKFKARQIARKPGFSQSDREDVEQSLILDLLKRLPDFDPAKAALNTFIDRIVNRKVASLLRHHKAEKRSRQREECSLNDPVLDADGRVVDRHQTTPEASGDWLRRREMQQDIATVLERLPETLRLIAMKRVRGTIASIAREQGISRGTVTRHIEALRRACEDAGLRDYLR